MRPQYYLRIRLSLKMNGRMIDQHILYVQMSILSPSPFLVYIFPVSLFLKVRSRRTNRGTDLRKDPFIEMRGRI